MPLNTTQPSRVNSTQILLHRFVFTIWSWRIQVEPGGCLRAGNIISLLSHDDISDPRSQNRLKLDDHVLHLHDGHGGGDGDHLHGPQGGQFIPHYLKVVDSARIQKLCSPLELSLTFRFVKLCIHRFINVISLKVKRPVVTPMQIQKKISEIKIKGNCNQNSKCEQSFSKCEQSHLIGRG